MNIRIFIAAANKDPLTYIIYIILSIIDLYK